MKISVCFKVLPDFDKVPRKDWERPGKLDFEYVKKIFGVFDEGALETALSLRDEIIGAGGVCFAEAVTYGSPEEIFVSTLYALGFDRVVEIHGHNSDFSPEDTAKALAEYYSGGGKESCFDKPDIILLGKMTGPNDSGLVPYFLGEKLSLPVLDKVVSLELDSGRVLICRQGKTEAEKYVYRNPLLAIVEDAKRPYLRLYTLISMMENKNKKPKIIEYRGKPVKNNNYKLVKPEKKNNCEFIDLEPEEVINYLKKEIEKAGNTVGDGAEGKALNKAEPAIRESGREEPEETREVYSGYLILKPAGTLFKGKFSVNAGDIKKKLPAKQSLYTKPDYTDETIPSTDRLSKAEVVAVLGRGIGNKSDYERIKNIFEDLGIFVGCTRPVAMNGYENYSRVIGISGKTLSAKLCICMGVSGAGPFCQGLKNVKKIVAVNIDKDALIFDRADIGIICDVGKI